MKSGFLNKTILIIILINFTFSGFLLAQNKSLVVWGIENALPKYSVTKFNRDYFYVDGLGSVPTTRGDMKNWNYAEDLNLFVRIDKNNWEFRFAGGLFSERLKLNTEKITIDEKSFDAYSRDAGVRLGATIGYKLWGKRATHFYLSGGLNADVVKFQNDVNPINWIIGNFNRPDAGTAALFGQKYTPLYKKYYIPPIGATSSIDMRIYQNVISLVAEYKNKNFGFANTKEPLYESSYLFKLQWAFIIGYKYK